MDIVQFLNDLLLAGFLYATFFTLLALLLNEMQPSTPKTTKAPPVPDYRIAFAEENDPSPVEQKPEPKPIETAKETPQRKPLTVGVLSRIISELKQPQLRKLCRPLGIQQKRNGVWLSTDLMRAEIQRLVKQQPETVMQVLQERLPDVVPTTTNLQSA